MLYLIFPAVLSAVLLPNWLLLVWGVPFGPLDYTPALSFGDAHIRFYDMLILVISLKVFSHILVFRRLIHSSLYQPIIIFLVTMLGATFLSYYRFGPNIFEREVISFARFVLLFFVFFLTVHSIFTHRQLVLTHKCLIYFGFFSAASVYLGFALFKIGIEFGEISPITEESADGVRTFGIFGDQIGFILPFFLYKEILSRRALRAIFFGVAILQTGTRGALIALCTGLVLIPFISEQGKDFWKKNSRRIISVTVIIAVAIIAFNFNLGGIRTRFGDRETFDLGITARGATLAIATEVLTKNLITGVGFSGFRLVASDYGTGTIFAQGVDYSSAVVATAANQFLQVATDAGILGLITFIWMMMRCIRVLKLAQEVVPVGLKESLAAAHIWLWSLLVGAQSVTWLLPDMTLSYILCIILGMATAAISMKHTVAD